MLNRIQVFEDLEKRLSTGTFKRIDYKSIEKDIEDLVDSFWLTQNDALLMQPSGDLEDLCAFHLFLIRSVSIQLERAYSHDNEKLLRTNLSARDVLPRAVDGKTADGIVLLPNPQLFYIIGDLHADFSALKRVFMTASFFENVLEDKPTHLIFMGDYVDRGKAHLKTLELLLIMKALFPGNITLLRGNHDGGKQTELDVVSLPYRIPETDNPLDYFPRYLEALEISNPTFSKAVLPAYLNLFDRLPYIAFLKMNDKVFQCVHGGLPKPILNGYAHLKCLSDLTRYPILDNTDSTICQNIMWSDPQRDGEDLKLSGKRFKYSEAHFDQYAARFGIDILYRGHEEVNDGIRSHFGGKVFTVFSSGESPDSYYQKVTPKIVHLI